MIEVKKQFLNAFSHIKVTELGIWKESGEFRLCYLIIFVPSLLYNTPSILLYFEFSVFTVIEFKELESSNVSSPIFVIDFPIVISLMFK